ncbi:MAG: pyruvate, phosphate dikinase [Sandaracinaceae bacterium]
MHRFSDPLPLDGAAARRWLGGKGASVAEMTQMALPVPPGFTLGTELWRHHESHGALPDGLRARLVEELTRIEEATERRFGGAGAPLLLAVRSGGPSSMPGMLDTVLNVGVNAALAEGLTAMFGAGPRFAPDVRRRFLECWGTTVMGVPREAFSALQSGQGVHALDAAGLEARVSEYERTLRREAGVAVPEDPWEQLLGAIEGVLRSWRSPRAVAYRAAHGIDDDEGTGVTVQAMVYGNLGRGSSAGVVFTRDPNTGAARLHGEWLPVAQGEDVVGGRRTPLPLTRAQVRRGRDDTSFESAHPEVYEELQQIAARLEERYLDVQDLEFTVEDGRLYVLQCRAATRSARAAVRIAVEMSREGRIDEREALRRVEPVSLRKLITPQLPDPEALARTGTVPLARGLAASPGAASGVVVFDAERAKEVEGDKILVRAETSAEDVEAMRSAVGILTAAGGLTCHAAVVARALGTPCVAGVSSLHVDYTRRCLVARGLGGTEEIPEGATLTLDGGRGLVYRGRVPEVPAPSSPDVETLMQWARERCQTRILAEAHSLHEASVGHGFGADGVFYAEALDVPLMLPVAVLQEAAGGLPILVLADPETIAERAGELRDVDGWVVAAEALEAARAVAGETLVYALTATGLRAGDAWIRRGEDCLRAGALCDDPAGLSVAAGALKKARMVAARG